MARRIWFIAAALIALTSGLLVRVTAGPLLDDYLNYARAGEKVLPSKTELSGGVIGQSFAVAPNTAEIYRIGVYANTDAESWSSDETVTLTLYDSPKKAKTYGSFTIDQSTNRTQGLRNHEADRLLLFPLRQDPLKPPKYEGALAATLYFEITVKGGDGKVGFRSASQPYSVGAATVDGQAASGSLAFETDIKPVPDRVANLNWLYSQLDLNYAPLATVKAAIDAKQWDTAEAELVKHFHNRQEIWDAYKQLYDPIPDPKYDRSAADKFLEGFVRGEKGEWFKWRKQSFWAPEVRELHGTEWGPKPYTWHIERMLGGAYTASGDAKYARAAIDNRSQWMLDNSPNPEITGIEAPHETWNELASGGRAPGHGDLAYARLYNFKGWTDDERLLWILCFYDQAQYMLNSDKERNNGGNWLVQTAENTRNFGMKFPEFKQSPTFTAWGSLALANETLGAVRPDGTDNESAIKYHAMIARRLKSLIEDEAAGHVTIEPGMKARLRHTLEIMYDHMAYTLQPNGNVVMYGDAWYENDSAEVAEVAEKLVNRPDLLWIATQGKRGNLPKTVSKSYPDGGFFIMRSDFGGPGKTFTDARQLLVHNGGWIGGHGHWDLLGINLYGFGRTLLIDPGGMWNPTEGGPYYWKSNVHSTLVPNNWDMSRDPGSTLWVSRPGFDYIDGVHSGYTKSDIPEVRRRIVYVKPDYFVVDDSAKGKSSIQWDQVWNLLAAKDQVKVDSVTKTVETTFADGGANLIIQAAGNTRFDIVSRAAEVPMDAEKLRPTTVEYFRSTAVNPRYTTVLYPYKGSRPNLGVQTLAADSGPSDGVTGVKVSVGGNTDYVVLGNKSLGAVSFGNKTLSFEGDMLSIRTSGKTLRSYSLHNGRGAAWNGRVLAKSDSWVAVLDVAFKGSSVTISAKEADPSLVVWVGNAKSVVLNGNAVKAKPSKGYLKVFAGASAGIVVDDSSAGFRKITQTNEWETIGAESGYGLSYQLHETDPGRHEAGAYKATIGKAGDYRIEVFIPRTTRDKSDAMSYTVKGAVSWETSVANSSDIVKDVKQDLAARTVAVVVDQQKANGVWVSLGVYGFAAMPTEFLEAVNQTTIDGTFPVFDAVRLVSVSRK
ncbi:MAG: heparinase II/III family protein [Armatimonadota bacterium]